MEMSKLVSMLNCCGCGVDYITFLQQHPIKDEYDHFLSNDFPELPFTPAIEKAMHLLEKYYHKEFYNTKSMMYLLLEQQHKQASKDIFDVFWSKFTEWAASNHMHFVRVFTKEDGTKDIIQAQRPCVGVWYIKSGEVYVFTSVFEKWCRDEGLHHKTCLHNAKRRGKLRSGPDNRYRVVKHIPGINTSVATYYFLV